jgi:hypothetical protein
MKRYNVSVPVVSVVLVGMVMRRRRVSNPRVVNWWPREGDIPLVATPVLPQ